MKTSTFRYNFSDPFVKKLIIFAKENKNNDFDLFNHNHQEWLLLNKDLVKQEELLLKNLGYIGDINDKIFKSARYYFNNKSFDKKAKKRKKYTKFNKSFLKMMDQHIVCDIKNNLKPEIAFKKFVENPLNIRFINNEFDNLSSEIEKFDINLKLKKTFKNRYYTNKKKMNKNNK
jgi:hypothetical protein